MLRACNALCARISAAVTSQGFTAVTFSAVPAVEVRNAVLVGLIRELAAYTLTALLVAFIIDVDTYATLQRRGRVSAVYARFVFVPLTREMSQSNSPGLRDFRFVGAPTGPTCSKS